MKLGIFSQTHTPFNLHPRLEKTRVDKRKQEQL